MCDSVVIMLPYGVGDVSKGYTETEEMRNTINVVDGGTVLKLRIEWPKTTCNVDIMHDIWR